MEVDNNKIIHIYCLDKCNHHCALCCNKQYDTNAIPVVTCDELRYADNVRDRLAGLAADLKDYESVKVIDREWQTEFVAASGIFRRLPVLFN